MATSELTIQYFPPFDVHIEVQSLGIRWQKYLCRFDNYLIAMNIFSNKHVLTTNKLFTTDILTPLVILLRSAATIYTIIKIKN